MHSEGSEGLPLSLTKGDSDDAPEHSSLEEGNLPTAKEGNENSFHKVHTDRKLSLISRKYDRNGNGELSFREQMLRDMDKGDGLDANEVYEKIDSLLKIQKKYSNFRTLFIVAIAFCAFTLCSNLLMGFIAFNLSKDMKVSGGNIATNNKEARTLATIALGTTATASLTFLDGTSLEDRRLQDSIGGRPECAIEDFDDVASEGYFKGSLPKSQCDQLYTEAKEGARPLTIVFQRDTAEASHVLNEFTTASFSGGGCNFIHAFIQESEIWYLKSCGDENECHFFIAPKAEVPLPCCLVDPEQDLKQAGEVCACDDQCESKLCESDGDNVKTCLTDSNFEGYVDLAQDAFNNQGELNEITPALFNEMHFFLTKIVGAVQNTRALTATDYNYAQFEQFTENAFKNDDEYTYTEWREQQEGSTDNLDIRFAKESGCIHDHSDLHDVLMDPTATDYALFVAVMDSVDKPAEGCISAYTMTQEGEFSIDAYRIAKQLDFGVVEKVGDICYGAFRGTLMKKTDWVSQNFNQKSTVVGVESSELQCRVRSGFQRTFIEESELWKKNSEDDGMEHALRNCAAECVTETGKNCTVILGGHSQGGALATVASIYLHDLNPVVITSAAPAALYPVHGNPSLCPLINKDRSFRFVAARNALNDLNYDPVPQLTNNARHIGHEFRIVDTSSTSAAYFYNSKSPKVYANDYGKIDVVHHFHNYYEPSLLTPMKNYVDSSGESIQLGFEDSTACNKHSECHSNRCERDGLFHLMSRGMTCEQKKPLEANCVVDVDCQSGRCDRICKEKLPEGVGCSENSDCRSHRCDPTSWWNPGNKICKGRLELGERCNESSDCLSGRCDGILTNEKCEARLPNGEGCNEDTDCISENCPSWRWRRICSDFD